MKWLDLVLRLPWYLLMSAASIVEEGVVSLCVLAKDGLFPGAVVAVVVGRFDFVSRDGLAFLRLRSRVCVWAGFCLAELAVVFEGWLGYLPRVRRAIC